LAGIGITRRQQLQLVIVQVIHLMSVERQFATDVGRIGTSRITTTYPLLMRINSVASGTAGRVIAQ